VWAARPRSSRRGRGARVVAACRGEAPADSPARNATAASLDTEAPGFRDAVLAATDGRGPDVVYDCVGRPDLTEAAIEAVGFRGRVVVIAGTPAEKVRLELIPFYRREARLIGVDSLKRGAADCAPLMDALRPGFESGAYPAPIIAQAFPLEAAQDAYATVAAGSRGRIVLSMR
jgi:NADPH:quinone reductase-like Zn-dependent oxidoreductase